MGKGSGQTSTVTQQSIPKEFFPYFDRLLTRTEEASAQPYTAYGQPRLAGTTADTNAAYGLTRDIAARGNPALDEAMGVYRGNISDADRIAGQQPYQFSEYDGNVASTADPYSGFKETQASPYADFSAFKADPYANFKEGQFSEFGYAPTEKMTAETASQYMDPFLRNVLDVQKEKAREDYQIAQAGRNAAAVGAGAFGGSRQQVAESMAERDLMTRMRDIEATGNQAAYQDAASRFAADRAAQFQAAQAQAAERARVQAGTAGEAARVQAAQAGELGRIQSLDANEFARVQENQAAELARTQNISVAEAARIQQAEAAEIARVQNISIEEASRVQAAQAAERARVQQAQAAENNQSIQNQLTAMGLKGDMAAQMAQLEELARTGDIQAAQMLDSIGKAQQSQAQAGLDLGYEDFLRQQGWNQQQLGFLSSVLQGLPLANAGTSTQTTPYNPVQQALGAGLSALSLYKGFNA